MRVKTMSQAILLLGLIVAPCLAIAAEPTFKEGSFTTNDGIKLHYLEAGSGNPLVMIPGWSQSAMEFKYQLTGLSDKYHVYALDMRGHGESAKPNHGYRIQRLSADVHDFLVANNLGGVTLAGHSMGCSVIWGYWEQYGSDRLSKLILVDQMPMITSNPAWSPQELEDAGAIFDGKSLFDNVNALAGADGVKTTEGFIRGMFTKQYPVDAVNWVIQENLKFPREYAARLLFDHAHQRLARPHSSDQHPNSGCGRQSEPRSLEVSGLDRETNQGREDRNLRGERGRCALHVHGEPREVQPAG